MNLVINARDAMPAGGRLRCSLDRARVDVAAAPTSSKSRPAQYVMLAVSDTGEGIDAETLEHIFEPFFTTKAPGSGTGLGLSTVFGIVHQSGGAIDVHSVVKQGTTFRVYFPLSDAAARPTSSREAVDTAGTRAGQHDPAGRRRAGRPRVPRNGADARRPSRDRDAERHRSGRDRRPQPRSRSIC